MLPPPGRGLHTVCPCHQIGLPGFMATPKKQICKSLFFKERLTRATRDWEARNEGPELIEPLPATKKYATLTESPVIQ